MRLKLITRLRNCLSDRVMIVLITIWKVLLTTYLVLILLNSLNEVLGSITNLHGYVLVKNLLFRDQNYT